ncbi:hypothetical protein [Denitromonas halophila]|uniref:Uncharacterized protein n=1 Tax=Denitromonas halophila TaxID=1629404 RepID=A0A557QJS1_9RHOO|nr:hypothetical protein [Denitromonas halophila]TVO53153.1 hypothetical protein FHP91_15245 [Denitromonas halophila]
MDIVDQEPSKPVERNTKRRAPQVDFDADGNVVDWVYRVHRAFRPALDIVFSTRVRTKKLPDGTKIKQTFQEWTEGNPPLYAFGDFDTVPSREIAHGTTSRFIAQIGQSTPDRLEKPLIVSGSVGFRLYEWSGGVGGSYAERGWYRCTQAEFVEFLKTGCVPEVSENPSPEKVS